MGLRFQPEQPVDYPNDCIRIMLALARAGYSVTVGQAERMWRQYSATLAASWINLPSTDEEIIDILTD